jgi:hypothetical protein
MSPLVDMSFEFLKTDYQLLETGLQTPPLSFFRNRFLEVIGRKQFLYKLNGFKQGLNCMKFLCMLTKFVSFQKMLIGS